MIRISRGLLGVHGGFTRSGGNFRKNNWSKGRLDVGRIMTREPLVEVKFRKPARVTKHGFPAESRVADSPRPFTSKYCNMASIHEQEKRRNGMSVSDKSAYDAAYTAMSQTILRK